MGVASERAVSIPQITYDHIEDSQEKKDVSFFQEEPQGTVEGKEHCLHVPVLCSVEVDIKYLSKVSATCRQSEAFKLYCMVFFHQLRHVNEPRLYMKALGRVLLLRVSTDLIPLSSRILIQSLTPQNAVFFEKGVLDLFGILV